MKSCLAREQGKGGGSECKNKYCWTFVNKEKHIKNVFESDRSQLLSEVIEKPCFSTKNVSKWWAVHPMPPPGVIMRDSPHSWHQTCSRMCYDFSDSPQMAVSSNPSQSLERPCFHCLERAKPCQDGMVNWECLKMNIIIEKKLKTSSVTFSGQAVELDLCT